MKCAICGDTGFRRVSDLKVTRCECFHAGREQRLLAGAAIPARYQDATFENFYLTGPREPLALAHIWARRFAEAYPVDGERGAILIGDIGTGKTHLAIAILKRLVNKGFAGRFCDCATLLQDVRGSYDPQSQENEIRLLSPLFAIPVLIVDDLGSTRPSAWLMDTVATVLDTRYRRGLTTLITTNYPLEAAKPGAPVLEERLGERVVSRLREMCRFVEMFGPDYRETFGPKRKTA